MKPLPENVHLLTLEMYKPSQLLLRLEHQYEAGEDAELSKAVDVNIRVRQGRPRLVGWISPSSLGLNFNVK